MELLAAGHSDSDVAKQLDLHRTTIYRWRTQHPRFIAELSQLTSVHRSATVSDCLNLSLQHVLQRLRKKGRQSTELAIKLLCSPRFARLAADASAPRTLADVVNQIAASTRLAPTPEDLPVVLQELEDSISAPFLPEPPPLPPHPEPEPEAQPKPKPESDFAAMCRNRDYLRARSPRPEILAALQDCGLDCPGPVLESAVRRPDIEPFDIYYKYAACRNHRDYVPYHLLCGLDTQDSGLPGIYAPLEPELVAEAFGLSCGHLTHLGSHDLTGCNVSATKDALALKRNNQPILTIPRENLWRDVVLSRPPTAATPPGTITQTAA